MRGVILAGGQGTRLRPSTLVTNKHLLPVFDKPMIYYPLQTLQNMGIVDILIVTGGDRIGQFVELLGDGVDLGVNLTYRVQIEPNGIAGALAHARGFTGDKFVVILGDNYFSEPEDPRDKLGIFIKEIPDPRRFGVYIESLNRIVEKPQHNTSPWAVTGLYIYDDQVYDVLDHLVPSLRGELEITDVNNWYLREGAEVYKKTGEWFDMGTPSSLLRAANYENSLSS